MPEAFPKFSIAIPVYNRAEFVRQAVVSALRQTCGNFEIVISDDCSEDDLRSTAGSFHDLRIRYSRSDVRLGAARNHARAVGLTRGEFVVVLHSDDLLLPRYLETAGAALGGEARAAAVYSSLALLNDSRVHGCTSIPSLNFADEAIYTQNRWLEQNPSIAPTSCLFRRTSFDAIGGYRTFLRFAYDYDLYMRFMRKAEGVLFLPEILALYRQHDDQAARKLAYEGFHDVLDLWILDEYSHWPRVEIGELALIYLRNYMTAASVVPVLRQIWRNRLGWALFVGMGAALPKKIRTRLKGAHCQPDIRFREPGSFSASVREAEALLSILAAGTATEGASF